MKGKWVETRTGLRTGSDRDERVHQITVIRQVTDQEQYRDHERRNHAIAMRGPPASPDEVVAEPQKHRAHPVEARVHDRQIRDAHSSRPNCFTAARIFRFSACHRSLRRRSRRCLATDRACPQPQKSCCGQRDRRARSARPGSPGRPRASS